jgi:hypothetical protein
MAVSAIIEPKNPTKARTLPPRIYNKPEVTTLLITEKTLFLKPPSSI